MAITLADLARDPDILKREREKWEKEHGVRRTPEGYRLSHCGWYMKVAGQWEPTDEYWDMVGDAIEKGDIRTAAFCLEQPKPLDD